MFYEVFASLFPHRFTDVTCKILELADCVPEKVKAEVALEEWERGMANAG